MRLSFNIRLVSRFSLGIIILFFIFLVVPATIQAAGINPNIPGTSQADQQNPNPIGIINNFYQFALLIAGILAFGMIIYAAIIHTLAAGNPSKQGEAKSITKDALLGVLLLAGAFIILNTINPRLTTLELKQLEPIQSNNSGGAGGNSNIATCGGTTYGFCESGQCAKDLSGNYACAEGQIKDGYGCTIEGGGGIVCSATEDGSGGTDGCFDVKNQCRLRTCHQDGRCGTILN
jgi:hypothetical protein